MVKKAINLSIPFIFLIFAYGVMQFSTPMQDFFLYINHFLVGGIFNARKVLHFEAFFIFSILFILNFTKLRILELWLIVLSTTIILAVIEEALDLLKHFQPSILDIYVDVSGGIVALIIYTLFLRKTNIKALVIMK